MDNSKEGLIFPHKKPSLSSSFDPISEKQEEMSISSNPGINQNNKFSNKNSKEFITKNILDDGDFIKHSQTQKNKNTWMIGGLKNNYVQNSDDNKHENDAIKNINKSFKKKQSNNKKKILKRNSMQEKGVLVSAFSLSQLNNSDMKVKIVKKSSLGRPNKILLSNSYFNQNSKPFYNQDNSFSRHYSTGKSISNEVFEMRFINQAKNKKTVLNKGKLDFNDKAETKIFDQIKNSNLFEKSENILFKLKICYSLLALFSLLSVLLNISDTMIYNNNSLEYLNKVNNEAHINYKDDIQKYKSINERKISSKENNIRIFNGIFSLLCVFLLILIYRIRYCNDDYLKKNSKKERFKKMLAQYSKQRKKTLSRSKTNNQKEDKTKHEKIKVIDLDPDNTGNKDLKKDLIFERNKTIGNCIINIIFYPPFINRAFIGKSKNIIYVYPLNSLFLIISLYKISNIYLALFYLSPINNSFNKGICKSNYAVLDSKFMFRYFLNKFPLAFIFLNIIIIFISISIVLSSIEYFSSDANDTFWKNYIENEADGFFNVSSSFFFFILRNIYENHCIKSLLGKILLYIGGIIGMLVSSFFIYYMNNLIELTPEEDDAFSKLSKLLNPINKEHKASNLIKALFMLKKNLKDNQNAEKDYRLRLEDFKKPSTNQRKPIFPKENNFRFALDTNVTSNNLLNLNEIDNEEKVKFIKFIGNIFLLKVKFIVEWNNYTDNLKIARNSSQSFNDVLKTIGNKMDANITQLNNKIEVLIQNDQKFLNYIKFTSNNLKSIKSLSHYHNSLLQYLVEIHNEYVKQMIEIRKEAEISSPIIYKNSTNFPKRMKSNVFGNLHFKNKVQSKIVYDLHRKKKLKKEFYDFNYTKLTIKKQRSSMVFSKFLQNNALEEKMKQARSKQNTTKSNKMKNKNSKNGKRTRSLDNWKFVKNELKEKVKSRNSVKKIGRSVSFAEKEKHNNSK